MKPALVRFVLLLAATVLAQNGKWNVDPYNTAREQRQERIDTCFRDAPRTSAREAWLDRCLRDAR